MDGKIVPQPSPKDFTHPFNAGQALGMLVALTYLEKNKISQGMLDDLKWACATNAQDYLQKPAEDIFLLADNLVKEMK